MESFTLLIRRIRMMIVFYLRYETAVEEKLATELRTRMRSQRKYYHGKPLKERQWGYQTMIVQ